MQVRESVHHVAEEFFFPAESVLPGVAFGGVAAYNDFAVGKGDGIRGGRVVQELTVNPGYGFIVHYGDFHHFQRGEYMIRPGRGLQELGQQLMQSGAVCLHHAFCHPWAFGVEVDVNLRGHLAARFVVRAAVACGAWPPRVLPERSFEIVPSIVVPVHRLRFRIYG